MQIKVGPSLKAKFLMYWSICVPNLFSDHKIWIESLKLRRVLEIGWGELVSLRIKRSQSNWWHLLGMPLGHLPLEEGVQEDTQTGGEPWVDPELTGRITDLIWPGNALGSPVRDFRMFLPFLPCCNHYTTLGMGWVDGLIWDYIAWIIIFDFELSFKLEGYAVITKTYTYMYTLYSS